MSITGDDVRTAREALNWNRQQVADALGLTIAQVARIETRGPKEGELEGLGQLLAKAGVTVADDPTADPPESSSDPEFELPDPPVSEGGPDDPDRRVVSTEWRGIKRGQVVKIDGETGKRFRFGYHFRSPVQEYVSVYSTKNGGERSFRPERLRDSAGRVPRGS